MLVLLWLYLKKTYKVFSLSFIVTAIVGVLLGGLLLVPGLSFVLSCILMASIASNVLHAIGLNYRFWAVFFVLALMYMPALPLAYGLAVVSIGLIPLFILAFDAFLTVRLGKGFSLSKLLLNPRGRLETLRPILEERAINYATYLNILNDATTPGSVSHCESLNFTPEQEADFVARQTQAVAELPADLKILNADIDAREFSSSDFEIIIAQKKVAYQDYRTGLTSAQQVCFDAYLESTLALIHLRCPVAFEPVMPENQHQFIILEKRYQDASGWHPVPQATTVFYMDPAERDMFLSLVAYSKVNKCWTIKHPLMNELLFSSSTYHESVTQYRRYAYQKIAGHPLSLQICEAIEAFNLSMQVSPAADMTMASFQPALTPAPTSELNMSLPSSLPSLTPGLRPSSLSSMSPSSIGTQNIYVERLRREGEPIVDETLDRTNAFACSS